MPFSAATARSAFAAIAEESFDGLTERCSHVVSPTDLDDYRRFLALKVAAQDWYASLLCPWNVDECGDEL